MQRVRAVIGREGRSLRCRTNRFANRTIRWASIGTVPARGTRFSTSVIRYHGNIPRRYGNHRRHGNQSTTPRGEGWTGLFGKELFSSADGFHLATREALATARGLVDEIAAMAAAPPSEEVAVKMDELSDVLCQVADLSECVRLVHPDPGWRDAAQRASLAINAYVEQLNTDQSLHLSLSQFVTSEEFERADVVTRRTTELLMHDFETCGIHLGPEERSKVVELNNKVLELSHRFVYNAALPTLVARDDSPRSLLNHFSLTPDGAHVLVDHVAYDSPDTNLRSDSYRAYCAELPGQVKILDDLLHARQASSEIAGYRSFAHKTLKTCMGRDPDTVLEFLERLSDRILPLAREEADEMKRFRIGKNESDSPLQLWDVNWCMREAQKKMFSSKVSELRDYLSLGTVLGGLAHLFRSLFGVTMETVPAHPGEVWSDDVVKLGFRDDRTGEVLGYTYCDLFAREGKMISDCHFTIQGGRERRDGSYQLPIIALCCNFTRGHRRDDDPLLSLGAVENLFHEMGHALHSILGRSRYQNVTGTRCSTDFAEVPSTLMELFLADPRVLESVARHRETGRPIPKSHMSTVQFSAKPFPAFDMQVQVVYALTDLLLHSQKQSNSSSCVQTAHDIFSRYSPIQPLPGTTWILRFNHLYGYGARYYSYLWARAVSSLIWNCCFQNDPFSSESGYRLREMLSHGGGVHPDKLLRDLLTFEPSVSDLVDTLHTSVVEHRQALSQLSNHSS